MFTKEINDFKCSKNSDMDSDPTKIEKRKNTFFNTFIHYVLIFLDKQIFAYKDKVSVSLFPGPHLLS